MTKTKHEIRLDPWLSKDQRASYLNSIENAERIRKDMLRRLAETSVKKRRYADLEACEHNHCGREVCIAACPFGELRRLQDAIPQALKLLRGAHGPICEVRLARASWARDMGDLRKVSIWAAKQLNRRALNKLLNPELIALGTFKVFAYSWQDEMYWLAEIHELVAGAEEEDLTKAFDPGDREAVRQQYVRVKQVDPVDLPQTLTDVLAADLQPWSHPWQPNVRHDRPRRAQRTEYYRWALRLKIGKRLVRYGCDRHSNALQKQPQRIKHKPRKKRGYPWHLVDHMFNGKKWDHMTQEQVDDKMNPNKPSPSQTSPDDRKRYYEL